MVLTQWPKCAVQYPAQTPHLAMILPMARANPAALPHPMVVAIALVTLSYRAMAGGEMCEWFAPLLLFDTKIIGTAITIASEPSGRVDTERGLCIALDKGKAGMATRLVIIEDMQATITVHVVMAGEGMADTIADLMDIQEKIKASQVRKLKQSR